MKKLISSIIAAVSLAAVAEYQFIELRGAAKGFNGEVVAFDVQSTNDSQAASLQCVRDIVSYTNALDIMSKVVTNTVYFVETNGVMGVSNEVSTLTTTNGYKKVLCERNCVTNILASITCTNGFATADFSAWVFRDDAIIFNCTDKAAKATVVIIK